MGTTYKKIDIIGTSDESMSQAISNAVEKACETLHNLSWFEVVEQRGHITDGKVTEFQATVRIGFRLD